MRIPNKDSIYHHVLAMLQWGISLPSGYRIHQFPNHVFNHEFNDKPAKTPYNLNRDRQKRSAMKQEQIEQNVPTEKGMVIKMVKAVIVGCACVILSNLTPEDIDRYKLYQPKSLTMYDDSDEPVWTLDIDDGPGSLSKEKAVFSRAKSNEGKATITILVDPNNEDKLGLLQEELGSALLQLEELEKQLLEHIGELEETEARVKSMLTYL